MLISIVLGEVELPGLDKEEPGLIASLDVLCWVLEDEHNTAFDGNLGKLRQAFARYGIVEQRA